MASTQAPARLRSQPLLARYRRPWIGWLQVFTAGLMLLGPLPSRASWSDTDSDSQNDTWTDPTSNQMTALADMNSQNTDVDGDGATNDEEAAEGSDPYSYDTDRDGLNDGDELHLVKPSLGVSLTNWDSDSDFVSDYDEWYNFSGVTYPGGQLPELPYASYSDYDGDGIKNPVDADPTDPSNPSTTDSDGDGIMNSSDPFPSDSSNYSSVNSYYWYGDVFGDADGDGTPNWQDSDPYSTNMPTTTGDSDGDGIQDGQDPYPNDSTNYSSVNGIAWHVDFSGDADSDGILNHVDPEPYGPQTQDADSDGFVDSVDPFPNDSTNYSSVNGTTWYENVLGDADGDGTPNWQDNEPFGTPDADSDGFADSYDPYPYDSTNYSATNGVSWYADVNGDADGDFTLNWADSTPYPEPPSSTDADGDGLDDASDPAPNDSSNYSYYNNQPWYAEALWDADNDGTQNWYDAWPTDPYNGTWSDPDTDMDGMTDSIDPYPNDPWNNSDSDADGLTDLQEVGFGSASGFGTDPYDVDTDNDYLSDYEEVYVYSTNPLLEKTDPNQLYPDFYHVPSADTDGDTLPDNVEDWYTILGYGLDKTTPGDAQGDLDGDGITNAQAYNVGWSLVANLVTYDLDGDGITDVREDYWSLIHPGILNKAVFADAVQDPDNDGVMNFEEIELGTNPGISDTNLAYLFWRTVVVDEIGLLPNPGSRRGGWRIAGTLNVSNWKSSYDERGTPADPSDPLSQEHGNGIPDGLDAFLLDTSDLANNIPTRVAADDFDGDGLSDVWEYKHHLGLRDRWNAQPPADWQPGMTPPTPSSIFGARYEPTDWDADEDQLTNLEEYLVGTDPRAADSDSDEYTDREEVLAGTDPLDSNSYPVEQPDPGEVLPPNPGGAGPSPSAAKMAQMLPAGTPLDKSLGGFSTEDGAPPPNPPIVEYDIQTIDEEGQASPVHTVRSESASFWHYPAPEEPEPGCGCGGNSFSSQCICGGHWAEVDDYTQPLPDGTFVKMSEWVSDCECLEYTPPNNFSRSKGKVRVRFSNPITRGMRFEFQEIRSVTGGNAYPSTVEVHIPKGGTQGETRQYDPSENELYVITYSGVVEEEPDPPSSSPPFTLTASDGAGPRYRKIGLNGAPLPDSKPQVQDESGELPEETYIDALTRELRHSVTEVYASMESSLLPLMVRRDVVEDTWNAKSGLRADERADRPFGSGWTSNITSHVRLEDGLKIYVTDEQGASQVFLRDPANDGGWIHTKEERVDTKAGMNTLHSVMVDNKLVGFTYRKKFGTTCHYRKCALIQTFPANRVKGEGDLITNQYFRLWKVEDRLGNSLVYTYPSTKTLIPYTIADPQRQGHYISIRQEGGVVTQVRGPGGDTASYNYEMVDGAPVLTEVKRGGATVKYAYSAETELDPNEPPPDEDPTPVRHIAVNKITDENGGSYTFNLQFNTGVTYTKFQDDGPQLCHQIGLPRYVTNVQLPDGSNTQVDGIRTLHVESPSLEGVVAEASTNVNGPGGSTSYTFSDLDVFVPLVPDIDNIDDPFSRHLTVSFQKMEVSRGGGTETYEFDVEHAMSLVQATDRNGNSTDFSYDWFDDPASETNAMNGVKTFTYDPLTRVMASVTDEAGTRTEYTIQAGTGLRTEERIIGSGGTVRRTEFKYEDSKFRGFLTRKIVQSSGNMPSYTVQYTPDSVGRVHEEKVIGGGTTKYYHDYAGNKRFVVDPRGNCTEFTYDARYRLRRVTHPDASRKHLVYDLHGNLTQEINELGARTTHQYDALNRRVKSTVEMTDADDIVLTTSYNGMNLPVVETTPNRPNTTHGYDALGRRTSTQTGPLHTTFEYGSNSGSSVFDVSGFKPTKSTGPRGVVTTVQYDDMYRAVSTTVSDGGTTTTEYDAVGRPVEVTDALGRSTTTTYDALGQAIRVDLPDGTEVETKYTQLGKPWWVKDGLGRITETEYDSAGRAISVTNPLGQTVHSEYDAAGNAIKVTDARGHITESSYDSRNRPIEVKAPAVVNGETGQSERPITTTTYDAAGKPLSVTDPLGHVTLNTYDQASRVVKVKNALHQETLTTYDASGNVLTVTDANGKVTTNEYDSLGRLSLTTDAEGVLTEFDYDLSGNRTMVKDGKGNVTTFDYDLQNRVTEEHYANGDETTYTYNALQKLTRTDAAGTTSYTYDNLNRLLTVDFVTGPDRAYAYDDAGQLLSVTETGHAAADVSYTYDLAGKVLSETSRGKTHTYTYDAAGNRTGTTYSTGRSETRTYDALNRIATLVEGGRTTTWHYDLAGRAIALTLGNGQQQDNHYDAVGKLTARHLFNPNQTLIATFQWQHDAVGNVSQ
ncbi:YD repeat-containing protein, partial [Roseimicrobium gellanilyticum]